MTSNGFLKCIRSCDQLENEENRLCSVTAGCYYPCEIISDDTTHETVSYTITGDRGFAAATTGYNIKPYLTRVLYPITDKRTIRSLVTQREGLGAFSRDRDGNPTFYEIMPLELNRLVADCSFATISRKTERTTGYGLTLCYVDTQANTVSHTSELYITVPTAAVSRFAERRSWTLYDEEPASSVPEALFVCVKSIAETNGQTPLFEEGRLYPVERNGHTGAAVYRLKQSPVGDAFHITREGLLAHFHRVGQIIPNREMVMPIIPGDTVTVQSFTSGRTVCTQMPGNMVKDIVACADKAFLVNDTKYTNGAYIVCYKNTARSMFEFTFIGGKDDVAAAEKAAAAITFLPAKARLFEFDDELGKHRKPEFHSAQKRYVQGRGKRAREAYL